MDKETQEESLNNWIGWIQKRIPEAKESHNEQWLRIALDGYHEQQVKNNGVSDDVSGSTSGIFNDAIDKWHEGKSDLELYEYLGLTKAEYGIWLLHPNLIEQYYR